ncbi:DUF4124 domain-containing protein [Microbulbifer sediminum]|uniref:DUF4124 domain-containing protein n=1 Tax=Microbulbifer sediminum TaxID=2904250 RepID=UPI0034E25A68
MSTIVIRIFSLLLLISAAALARAEIYQCVDNEGRTVFSDHKCSEDDSKVRVVEPRINVAPFKDVLDEQEKSSRVIYRVAGLDGKAGSWMSRSTRKQIPISSLM